MSLASHPSGTIDGPLYILKAIRFQTSDTAVKYLARQQVVAKRSIFVTSRLTKIGSSSSAGRWAMGRGRSSSAGRNSVSDGTMGREINKVVRGEGLALISEENCSGAVFS